MDFRYYRDIPDSHHIWFKLIDINGKLIKDFGEDVCFGPIVRGFDASADVIQIYHDKHLVPYSVTEIKNWIDSINDMGFPCRFEEEVDSIIAGQLGFINETVNEGLEDMTIMIMRQGKELPPAAYNFFVNIHDYEDKNHMFSTLFLIRCLLESGINRVPEEYFKLMDVEPQRDKLEACQLAHKIVSCKDKPYDPKCYANVEHMVTSDGNGENITQVALMERFAKCKVNVRDKGYLRVALNWNCSNDKGWQGKG
jgi:hypothetical protein